MTEYSEKAKILGEVLIIVILIAAVCSAVVYVWLLTLEDANTNNDDIPSFHWLDLIVGFLYIGLVKRNLDGWKRECENLTKLFLCMKSILVESDSNKIPLRTIYCGIKRVYKCRSVLTSPFYFIKDRFIEDTKRKEDKVRACIEIIEAVSTIDSKHKEKFHGILDNICINCFNKTPVCFTFHNSVLLIIFFGLMPVELYKSFGANGTYITYPIIIYFLYSVIIWASVFHNPMEHMLVDEPLKRLHNRVTEELNIDTTSCPVEPRKYQEGAAGLALKPMPIMAYRR